MSFTDLLFHKILYMQLWYGGTCIYSNHIITNSLQCWQVTAWGKLSAMAGHHSFFRAVGSPESWSLDCQRW